MKILIVDDEPPIVQALEYNLRREGFDTVAAGSGPAALEAFEKERPDLVLLDIMLPGMSGSDVCRSIRRHSAVPILMLTARAEETDRVVGLEIGADDYVVKPFSMKELVARIKAHGRRASMGHAIEHRHLSSEELELDLDQRRLLRAGAEIPLSRREFELLAVLMSRPGVTYSRQELLRKAWGSDSFIDERTVDVHVRWLRAKIETRASEPEYIQTVRGVGYRFRP